MLRTLIVLAGALALTGCAATKREAAEVLAGRFVGKNADTLIVEFGPPASAFRMNGGGTAYVWQLGNTTEIDVREGSGTASTYYCKVSVIASPAGIVTHLKTEDVSGTGGIVGALGVDIHGSLCARRLGIPRQI